MYSKLYNEVQQFKTPSVLEAATKGSNFATFIAIYICSLLLYFLISLPKWNLFLSGGKFLTDHVKCADGSNRCHFIVTRDGKPVKQQRTLFSECFYLMAMSELARVTKEQRYRV